MGRNQTRNTTLSLDTIGLIKRLYPNQAKFWDKHLSDTDITIQYFYNAMRHGNISLEAEQVIESNLEYDLRHLRVDRDELAALPQFSVEGLIPEMIEYLENLNLPLKGTDEQLLGLLAKLRVASFIVTNMGVT